jgi:two-component system sensor histidine kinase KdpD
MMFGVSYALSELAGRLRRQERDAVSREERTAALYALTRELASTDHPDRIAAIAARRAADVFAARALVLGSFSDGDLRPLGSAPSDVELDAKDLGVAKWAYDHDDLAGLGTDTLPGSRTLCAPLRAGPARLGVLVLLPAAREHLRTDQRAFLDVFSRQVAVALERARLSEEARLAALRARTEEMRSSLLSAVSHDLRTPLASITGAATALRDDAKLPDPIRGELVDSIVEQAERLERLVANLLDMTRLESGGVVLKRDWVPLDEIVGSALTRLETRLETRPITVDLASDVPLILVDPVLFQQVFVNLLENADKYTPSGSPLEIRARTAGQCVVIEVSDHGPGLPEGAESRVFEKFFRATHQGMPGAGLGLPICKGILEAHGGSITAGNLPGAGAVFRLTLPCGATPPSLVSSGGSP